MTKQQTMGPELQQQVWERVSGEADVKTKTPPRSLLRAESAPRSLLRANSRSAAENNGDIRRTFSGLKEMVESLNDVPEQFVLPPHLQPGHTAKANPRAVNLPLIDITGVNDSSERRKQIVKSIYDACKDWGFFQVVGHGVPVELRQRMLRLARDFFELPVEEKAKYEGGGPDPLSPLLGRSRTTTAGHHSWRDLFKHRAAPVSDDDVEEWPTEPESYRDTVKEYTQSTQQVATTIFELLAEGLGLNSQHFVEALGGPQDIDYVMMMAYYPRCPQPDLALGLIGHTDPNLITLLIQDELGLEVRKDGLWIPVVPASNGLVVNIGDSLQIMTNDKFKSIKHRVVASQKRDRVSAMIFVQPKSHVQVSVVQDLVPNNTTAMYKDIPWSLYLKYASQGLDKKLTNLALK